ncbi:hypothetical protein BDV93DRAFT_515374 [Ceratobasidium sp. AG-I]|nr:hypothetical protein BDV93DRAFT_515374 [Ceratobasidium sp. AG-I]
MDICHKVSGYIESAERSKILLLPLRDPSILLTLTRTFYWVIFNHVAGDMINEEPGNSGNVVQECSMPHGLNTSVTLRRIAANLATSATGDNWINDVLSYDNRPLGSNNATLSLPERLEFVLGSQVGSNVKLPALNLLIQIYSTEHLMSDNNKTRLPAKPLAVGRLLLDRASIVDSASDMDLSIVYLTKDVLVSRGECTSWAAAMNLLYSAHIHSVIKYLRQRIARMGKRHNTYVIMRLKLGGLHLLWHEVLRASNHLQGAIECLSHAWVLIPDEADSRTKTLSNLGSSHLFRFERRSELENISKAINCQIRAVHLMPKGHPDMPSQSNNLGISYRVRWTPAPARSNQQPRQLVPGSV